MPQYRGQSALHLTSLRATVSEVHHLAVVGDHATADRRQNDHAAIAMMRGDFVQSGRRGILDVLAGETHTIRHLMGATTLMNASPMPVQDTATVDWLANVPQPGSGESPTRPCIWW